VTLGPVASHHGDPYRRATFGSQGVFLPGRYATTAHAHPDPPQLQYAVAYNNAPATAA
jgi:hypothetical protein